MRPRPRVVGQDGNGEDRPADACPVGEQQRDAATPGRVQQRVREEHEEPDTVRTQEIGELHEKRNARERLAEMLRRHPEIALRLDPLEGEPNRRKQEGERPAAFAFAAMRAR